MKPSRTTLKHLTAAVGLAIAIAGASVAQTQPPPPPPTTPAPQPPPQAPPAAPTLTERVAALKKSLVASKAALKNYEWIETTVVFMKDEEKSMKQQQCYYGADGKVQKIVIDASPEPKSKPGIRGRIIEKKKEELSSYMKQAIALVHKYVPPDPELVQLAKEAGKSSVAILEPGKRISLRFTDFLIPGDELKAEMTLADNRLAGIAVSTFLDDEDTASSEKDSIALKVRMGTLEDGTTFAEESTLEAPVKHLKVVVTNSGYRKRVQ